MGVIIGGLLALVFTNIGGSVLMFVVGLVAGTIYLARKPLPAAALGTALYISVGLLVLYPVFLYVPMLMGVETGTAEGAGTFIGSIVGLFLWGFVFLLVALVVFTTGYFLNRRARGKLDKREGAIGGPERTDDSAVT